MPGSSLQPETVARQPDAAGRIDLAVELPHQLGKQRVGLHVPAEEFRRQALAEFLVDQHADGAAGFQLAREREGRAGMRGHEIAHALACGSRRPCRRRRGCSADGRARSHPGRRPRRRPAAVRNCRVWAVKTMNGRGLSRSSTKSGTPETSTRPGSVSAGSKSNSPSRKTYSAASRPMLPQLSKRDRLDLGLALFGKGVAQIGQRQLVAARLRPDASA